MGCHGRQRESPPLLPSHRDFCDWNQGVTEGASRMEDDASCAASILFLFLWISLWNKCTGLGMRRADLGGTLALCFGLEDDGPGAPKAECQTACKPGSVHAEAWDGHSSGTRLAARLARPTRATGRECPRVTAGASARRRRLPLFGLAPGGVCRAAPVARGAVRSYRTVSPLPSGVTPSGGLFSVALSLRSPSPAVSRHRIPVEPGLSSNTRACQRPSGRLANVLCAWPPAGASVGAGSTGGPPAGSA